ncbi:MAG: ABC transporter permease subunit [Desulfovibrio sp.]|nr:MAG: ABC transporter permease subunit [Desulfovibrio sp.]
MAPVYLGAGLALWLYFSYITTGSATPVALHTALSTIAIFSLLAWQFTKNRPITWFAMLGLLLILNMGLWDVTVSTIALVLVATLVAISVGIPLGIGTAMSRVIHNMVMPILDVMQTMPAFVYLIPAIPFFGLGKVAAIFSTVIFAMPPAIRLTALGIRQVPVELVECADAFGSTRWQKLFKLQLPLATPTIMAGVNQTVMLALSMVVIAAMIGAKGLGGEVWKAIQRLKMGSGFEAGIGIVIVAMILDRVLQKVGTKK